MIGKALSQVNPTFLEKKDRFQSVNITDIPVMICDDGSIACIKKDAEVDSIGIVGTSGYGKSLLLQKISESLFSQWKYNLAILNDVSEETYKWSEPMENKIFNAYSKKFLNQLPTPLPIVYLFLNSKDLKLDELYLDFKDYIKIAIPFSEIIEDIGFYLKGVNPNFELGRSGMYVNEIKEDLAGCDTSKQVRDTLLNLLPGKEGKNFQAMREKILTAFDSLMNEKILDITNPECHAYLKIKDNDKGIIYEGNPFSAIMKARAIPSFITSDLITKKYKSQVFAYFINQIFETNTIDFPGEKTTLVFDEIKDVCRNEKEPSTEAVANIVAKGRIRDIGILWATQFYNQLPISIKGAKLNYLFIFRHNDEKILSEISRDFNLNRITKKKILNLREFEVVATTQKKFVCYDNGNKWETKGPIHGRIFAPLSNHRKAGDKLK